MRIALHLGLISEVVGVLLESGSDVECLPSDGSLRIARQTFIQRRFTEAWDISIKVFRTPGVRFREEDLHTTPVIEFCSFRSCVSSNFRISLP